MKLRTIPGDGESKYAAECLAGALEDQAEALTSWWPDANYDADDIEALLDLPVEDLQAIAVTACIRGFGESVDPPPTACYPLCERNPERAELYRQELRLSLEYGEPEEEVSPPKKSWPNALQRVYELRKRYGPDWYGRELLRYGEARGVVEAIPDGEGGVVYRPTFG